MGAFAAVVYWKEHSSLYDNEVKIGQVVW